MQKLSWKRIICCILITPVFAWVWLVLAKVLGELARVEYAPIIALILVLPVYVLVIRTIIRRKPEQGYCQNCGYNLTGNVSGVCPECGTPILK